MNIELKDLLGLISEAVDAGVQKYVKSIDPAADYIKQSEAKRYISRTAAALLWLQAAALAYVVFTYDFTTRI